MVSRDVSDMALSLHGIIFVSPRFLLPIGAVEDSLAVALAILVLALVAAATGEVVDALTVVLSTLVLALVAVLGHGCPTMELDL